MLKRGFLPDVVSEVYMAVYNILYIPPYTDHIPIVPRFSYCFRASQAPDMASKSKQERQMLAFFILFAPLPGCLHCLLSAVSERLQSFTVH